MNARNLSENLEKVLRKDVAYITVCQHDEGILPSESDKFLQRFPNLLVLSGGGYGHVPLPLLLKERTETEVPLSRRTHFITFMGSLNTGPNGFREHMADIVKANGE